ncbi:hypothetical protein MYXO_01725 [Myxococcaceae bacterium]|jgi:DUF4097 and DUF4098 domain-containing protein YvlB|nr:hypothetical protein MYXO_01725 [Myxococcaceae bacterium]
MKSPRSHHHSSACEGGRGGFGGFLRTLLAGIPWSERVEGIETLHYGAPGCCVIRVHNSNGKTCVRGEDRDDIEVLVSKSARAESSEAASQLLDDIRVVDSEISGVLSLEVEIPRKWNRHGSVNLEIQVPRKLRVEVTASNGKVHIAGLRSSLKARSSNGSVSVCDVVGDVDVLTSNAKVECNETCGRLVARSSNGKIELDGHRGSVDASTSNGLISASVDEVSREGILLATSNGRIVLDLPEAVDADVDLQVDNGVIRNDRELGGGTRETNGRVRGMLGRGGAPIRLRTSNGSIALR